MFLQVVLCTSALLAISLAQDTIINNIEDTVTQSNDTTQEIGDAVVGFFHDSRNKLYRAFYNLSSYLPLNIEYAETVGRDCDIIEYNKDYYTTVGLILAACLAVVGFIFAYFGELIMFPCVCTCFTILLVHIKIFLCYHFTKDYVPVVGIFFHCT